MKKQVFGRKFKRDTGERTALFKGLVSSLVIKERIRTTKEKAKAIKGYADRLVTKAKKGGFPAMQQLQPYLSSDAVKKMLADIGPRFAARNGGYTRIIKIGERVSDNASMVYIEWVEKAKPGVVVETAKKTARSTKQKDTKEKKPVKKATTKKQEKKTKET